MRCLANFANAIHLTNPTRIFKEFSLKVKKGWEVFIRTARLMSSTPRDGGNNPVVRLAKLREGRYGDV
jgi:hypothetical protein